MASEVERIEAKLLASWSLDTVAELGAALRAIDHPRGELIALDFVIEAERNHSLKKTITESKEELQVEWLGDIGKDLVTKWGFVESSTYDFEQFGDTIETVLAYTRRLQLWGDAHDTVPVLETFVARPRPWLATLDLRCYGENATVHITTELLARLEPITPNLTHLEVRGHNVCGDIRHPGIIHVIADGHDGLAALRGEGCLPNARTLDLAVHPDFPIDREPPPAVLRRGLVTRAAFPRLERLDVWRNEPRVRATAPNCFGGRTPIFDVLPRFEILPHLAELRIPSIRDAAQLAQVQQMIDRMPALRSLEVARMYNDIPGELRHPTARITVAPRASWPAADTLREYDALTFQIGAEWERADLDAAYSIVEDGYATMTDAERAAWDGVWELVERVPVPTVELKDISSYTVEHIPAETMQLLLGNFDEAEHYLWRLLKEKYASFTESQVAVRHINGYEKPYTPPEVPQREAVTNERIVEHERALQEHWDLEQLAVYADDLQQLGDARGELIVMDLRRLHDPRAELDYSRDDVHDKIFGSDYVVTSQLGFSRIDVSCWSESRLTRVLVGDAARYLAHLRIAGPAEAVDRDLALVVAERRPWLTKLVIDAYGTTTEACIAADALPALFPKLDEFHLIADAAFPAFAGLVFPHVQKMRIVGARGFAGLGGPWPALTELDFAFGTRGAPVADPHDLLSMAWVPALRVLDLSRNEPASDEGLENDRFLSNLGNLFEVLVGCDRELFAQLTSLRLPSLRTPAQVSALQTVLDRMPALETLEIVRLYPGAPAVALRHPTAKITVPKPSVWTPADQLGDDAALRSGKALIPLVKAAFAMERYYADLGDAARRAWDELWRRIQAGGAFTLPAATLYTALDGLKMREDYAFDDVTDKPLEALHAPAIAEQVVTIYRSNRFADVDDPDDGDDDDDDADDDDDDDDDDA